MCWYNVLMRVSSLWDAVCRRSAAGVVRCTAASRALPKADRSTKCLGKNCVGYKAYVLVQHLISAARVAGLRAVEGRWVDVTSQRTP